jgi:hypothetical protein
MQVTLDIPDPLAKKLFSTTPAQGRSSNVARLPRAELRRRELTAACLAANRDAKLKRDIEDWQSFDEPVVETVEA